jgi:AcrR family transcriptional regulator
MPKIGPKTRLTRVRHKPRVPTSHKVEVSPRERLLDTAAGMFKAEGLHVGIDAILARSGVAKMTLYNHFASKDALMEATLRREHERWRTWFVQRVEARSSGPDAKLLSVFDVLEEWFTQPGFRGCLFLNATTELQNDHPARAAACAHFTWLHERLVHYARQAEVLEPEVVGKQATLLVAGAIATAHACGTSLPAKVARQTLAQILDK